MGNDLNIKSSTIEKGLELAKDFLDKLIMPAVEETGLLIKEKVTFCLGWERCFFKKSQ